MGGLLLAAVIVAGYALFAWREAERRSLDAAEVEARALYADDGTVVALYYFPAGGNRPLLREEDTTRDGRPDRWLAYTAGVRREQWEDRSGSGRPDVHVRFTPDGQAVESIRVDDDDDTRPERVFHYTDGRLVSESRDTDGDDVLDRVERFDDEGRVAVREEDLNADGHVDVRSCEFLPFGPDLALKPLRAA